MNNVSIDPGWVVAPLDVFFRDIILNRSEERVLPLVPAYVDIVRVDRGSMAPMAERSPLKSPRL